jgi:hypothetical protein
MMGEPHVVVKPVADIAAVAQGWSLGDVLMTLLKDGASEAVSDSPQQHQAS